MPRYSSAVNKLSVMACNTFGWTPAISTNLIPSIFRRLSTRCFAGIRMRSNAMSISQMCRQSNGKQVIRSPSILGNQHFGQVNGLLEANLSRLSSSRR